MIELSGEDIAAAARAEVAARAPGSAATSHPERAVIDSREVRPGDLFVGLPGERFDGGKFAADALAAGAWGVIVVPEAAAALRDDAGGWVLSSPNPLRALQRLAREWRRHLGAKTVGITGSTGKTSTKDICRALLPGRVHVSPENFNTEIGLPLAILGAAPDTQVLVLEMAMRGLGQIAELAQIAEADVGAITNIGPVHLELLGTLEAIAEAKAEIFEGLGPRGIAVLPEDDEALEPHLDDSLRTITFGPGGDVLLLASEVRDGRTRARVGTPAGEMEIELPFSEAYNVRNALCAIAIGIALGAEPGELAAGASQIEFSRLRGEVLRLRGDVMVLNDCYNANPISMRAALDHFATIDAPGRRVAVLGDMKELGPDAPAFHREVGAHARAAGADVVVGVGPLARDYAPDRHFEDTEAAIAKVPRLVTDGDVVLVKGSRSIGLERLTQALQRARPADG